MAKIVCVSCVKSKRNRRSKASDLYTSPLFTKMLEYAKAQAPSRIFILSAEHGLLELNDEIEPYEKTLNTMKKAERQQWAAKVLSQLRTKTDLQSDEFIFLAGKGVYTCGLLSDDGLEQYYVVRLHSQKHQPSRSGIYRRIRRFKTTRSRS